MNDSVIIPGAAKRGAALLDQKVPGWAEAIYLARLDLNDCRDCILGQLYGGDYSRAVDSANLDLDLAHQYEHGFDLPPKTPDGNWRSDEDWFLLRNEWIDEVGNRCTQPVGDYLDTVS